MSVSQLEVYGDNIVEADWFMQLSPLLSKASMVRMKNRAANVPVIADLLTYDRPDIILVADGTPVLVVEKTREVPTGHNVGQRMARLVRAIEAGVPTIKFFPFEAMKHGTYAGRCFLNVRLLEAFRAITRIHRTPLLAVNWPVDRYYELVDDGSENQRMAEIVHGFIASKFDPACKEIVDQLDDMAEERRIRVERDPRYKKPPASAQIMPTRQLLDERRDVIAPNMRAALEKRSETLRYTMGMTPAKCRREDPYTGTQFIYDYIWCRTGPERSQKQRNLVLNFPKLTRKVFVQANPDDPFRKSSNWYLTATAMEFADDFMLVHP